MNIEEQCRVTSATDSAVRRLEKEIAEIRGQESIIFHFSGLLGDITESGVVNFSNCPIPIMKNNHPDSFQNIIDAISAHIGCLNIKLMELISKPFFLENKEEWEKIFKEEREKKWLNLKNYKDVKGMDF